MIAQFALRLICGMSLMWALMPRRQVTSGFFRIQMLVVMGLGVLATLSIGMERSGSALLAGTWDTVLLSILSGFAFVGSVMWTLERRRFGTTVGFIVLGLGLLTLVLSNRASSGSWLVHERSWAQWLAPCSLLTNIVLLGSSVSGMLLGHWYLTSPTMSIEPLKRINVWLGVGSLLRLASSSFALWWIAADNRQTAVKSESVPLWIVPSEWLWLRWIAGVLGPILVSVMVWRILKYRNTQAATGVLFVGVILVFLGDMTAALLLRKTGLPL